MKHLILALALFVPFAACKRPDPTKPGTGATGETVLSNKGSDTMLEVALAWQEAYAKVNPKVSVNVQGGGSGTAVAALIGGTVDIANTSRPLKEKEIAEARKHGHDPVQHHVGYDGIAIFVHRDNPIEKLTLAQLGAIYGDGGSVTKWSQLGVRMPGGTSDEIVLISRQNNSGTYDYFKEAALHGKDFRLGTIDANSSNDVVTMVSKTRGAIGYAGLASANDTVKLVAIAKDDQGPAYVPTIELIINQTYPISRPLFMYTAGVPTGAKKEYLDWILSDDGQRVLAGKGYPPLRKL